MKVVILAGGLGTRISEETDLKPKPMVEVGGKPILWHIMRIYSHHGFNEFIICCGYKSYSIKDYFHHYYMHESDITIDLERNLTQYHNTKSEPWKVTLVDTGIATMTGGRIKRIQSYVGDGTFLLTYGDGLSDVDIGKLVDYHTANGRLATLTAVQPSGRFGSLGMDGDRVTSFQEKPRGDGAWVNGGFFVLEPGIFDYIRDGDQTVWERSPLEDLSTAGQLSAYRHSGFWHAMDTLRDKGDLENLWARGRAPWKVWD